MLVTDLRSDNIGPRTLPLPRDLFCMKQLRKHLLRTLQPLSLAALPMHDGIRIVQTLTAGPTKCADLNGRGRHHTFERVN